MTVTVTVFSRCICRWCRSRRYQNEAALGKRRKRLWDDNVGKEDYMPTDQVLQVAERGMDVADSI